jgi:quinol monooxygenase YgiN
MRQHGKETAMVVVAKLKVKPGRETEAENAFRKQIDFVAREEASTLVYLLHRGRKDRATYLFYERYADADAFDRHGKSAAMQELFRALQGVLDGPPSIELFDELGGKQ